MAIVKKQKKRKIDPDDLTRLTKRQLLARLKRMIISDALEGFNVYYGDKSREELIRTVENF